MVQNYCPNAVGSMPFLTLGGVFLLFGIIIPYITAISLPENIKQTSFATSISFTWRFHQGRLSISFFLGVVLCYLLLGCVAPGSVEFYFIVFIAVAIFFICMINGNNSQTILRVYKNPKRNVKLSYKIHSVLAFSAFAALTVANFFLVLGENEYAQMDLDFRGVAIAALTASLVFLTLLVRRFIAKGEWDGTCSRYEVSFAICAILVAMGCPIDPRQR